MARRLYFPVLAATFAAAIALLALSVDIVGADYGHDAAPAIDALARGDFGGFAAAQPLMGSFSLILRAPFVALLGGDPLTDYRVGAMACLLVAGACALLLERELARRGRPAPLRIACAALCIFNPAVFESLTWGHPEEALGGGLAVAAVLVAMRGQSLGAGLLLGLALATKQWAVLAVPVVLMAAPRQRVRALAAAAVVAIALTAPGALSNPESFTAVGKTIAQTGDQARPASIWILFADRQELTVFDGVQNVQVTRHTVPKWVGTASRGGVVVLSVLLAALLWARRPGGVRSDWLGLLALLFLLRCLLDPVDNGYYHAPFLFAVLAWDSIRQPRMPAVAFAAVGFVWLIWGHVIVSYDQTFWSALYLSWSVPMAIGLALRLFAPGWVPRRRVRTGRAVTAPAG